MPFQYPGRGVRFPRFPVDIGNARNADSVWAPATPSKEPEPMPRWARAICASRRLVAGLG